MMKEQRQQTSRPLRTLQCAKQKQENEAPILALNNKLGNAGVQRLLAQRSVDFVILWYVPVILFTAACFTEFELVKQI